MFPLWSSDCWSARAVVPVDPTSEVHAGIMQKTKNSAPKKPTILPIGRTLSLQ
jgi:hypothetical protein